MYKRTSIVQHVTVDSLQFASIFEIGDIHHVNAHDRALAIQRDEEIFNKNEGSFQAYPIFQEPIPLIPITEIISIDKINKNPFIKVNQLDINALSGSAILQIGNSNHIYLESRVKHIRQLDSKYLKNNVNKEEKDV
ncbi:spore germination protein GerPE [Bacillus massilinigeriensis]|uniref:spore germination protein GerPE n=1 Tax=Bacillus massilionigeriensis TaxID=1805475 RepID=UPI00096B1755|nr:spore germination protein GerPE [Bacillus massilionigeriensis]